MCEEQQSFPTILVAADTGSRHSLVLSLQRDGYLVFEASCEAEALFVVISQSRPIHVLLTDAGTEGRKLARALTPYRRKMKTVFFTTNCMPGLTDALKPEVALTRVRELLKLPRQIAADAQRNQSAGVSDPITFLGSSPLHAVQGVANCWNVGKTEEFRPVARAAAVGRPA